MGFLEITGNSNYRVAKRALEKGNIKKAEKHFKYAVQLGNKQAIVELENLMKAQGNTVKASSAADEIIPAGGIQDASGNSLEG